MALVLPEGNGDPLREFLLGPVDCLSDLVVITPARRAGDAGSNPGSGDNCFLKLLLYGLVLDYNTEYTRMVTFRIRCHSNIT